MRQQFIVIALAITLSNLAIADTNSFQIKLTVGNGTQSPTFEAIPISGDLSSGSTIQLIHANGKLEEYNLGSILFSASNLPTRVQCSTVFTSTGAEGNRVFSLRRIGGTGNLHRTIPYDLKGKTGENNGVPIITTFVSGVGVPRFYSVPDTNGMYRASLSVEDLTIHSRATQNGLIAGSEYQDTITYAISCD